VTRLALAATIAIAAACAPDAPTPVAVPTTPPPTPAPSSSTAVPSPAPTTTAAPLPAPPPRARAGRAATTDPPEGNAGAMEQQLAAIARCESGGRYDAENPRSTASGRYQVLDSTWDGYGGWDRAVDAPPEVQEAWAREAYARAGTRPWRASRGCWGRG
jgi:hypothetical protein